MFQSQSEFERIMMPHAGRLLRFAFRLSGSTSAAEDLVQEALLQAWRGFRQYRRDTNAGAWLFRILVNCFYGQHRKTRVARSAVPLSECSSCSNGPTTLEALEVQQAVAELPVEYRTVLLLAAVEGFTSREISEILSVPAGTVMSRLSRAREALRQKLAPEMAAIYSGKNTP